MGNWERNVVIFGLAGVLALAGVFISGPVLGMVWVFIILAFAMLLALGRFGPDRATLEEWILRRLRYARSVKRYTYARPQHPRPTAVDTHPKPQPAPSPLPVTWEPDPTAFYGAVSVLLVVAGFFFVTWLSKGGDAALVQFFQDIIRR